MGVDLIPFLMLAFGMVGTPGPANMVLLSTGARYGLRPALPFVVGVALGKQLIIWPMGFGLLTLMEAQPSLFVVLKYVSAAYILWLAWRIAGSRIVPGQGGASVPGFAKGLLVHPLNPKAWAMVTGAFTGFVAPGTAAVQATLVIALGLLFVQALLHPLWCWGGERIAALVAGKPAERVLMVTLGLLTALSVLLVLLEGV